MTREHTPLNIPTQAVQQISSQTQDGAGARTKLERELEELLREELRTKEACVQELQAQLQRSQQELQKAKTTEEQVEAALEELQNDFTQLVQQCSSEALARYETGGW